jgi:WD40 repeat protein
VFDQAIFEGKLSISQVAQLILTWKGIANFLGWGGVAPTLDPDVRSGLAYFFGHKFLALGDRAQAAKFFETAIKEAPPGSLLARLAAEDKQLVDGGKARLILTSSLPEKVRLRVRQNGAEVAAVDIEQAAIVDVPAGELVLELAEPRDDCRLIYTTLRLAPGNRRDIEVENLWESGPGESLWGLLSQPATAAAGARWQLHTRNSTHLVRGLAYSGDGQRVAVAATDGVIRVFDVASKSLVGILPGGPRDINGLVWSPHQARIVASGNDGSIVGWDAETLALLFRRVDHRGPVRTLTTSGSQFLAADDRRLRVWTEAGEIATQWNDPDSDIWAAALSPDGRCAAVRTWTGGNFAAVRVYDLQQDPAKPAAALANPHRGTSATRSSNFGVMSFSPDGQWFAAGEDARHIVLWRTSDWSRSATLQVGDGRVTQLEWRAGSSHLFVLVDRNGIHEVDLQAAPPAVSRRWQGSYHRLAVSPRDDSLVVAVGDGSLLRLNLKSDAQESFGEERREILTLALQPDGKLIAAAGVDHVLRLFDYQGRVVAVAPPLPPGRQILHLTWKPDGTLVAGTVNNNSIVLWRSDGTLAAD